MEKYILIGCIAGTVIGTILRIPRLQTLALPVLYTLIVMWMPGWSTAHPVLSNGIFYGLVGLNVLSWIIGLLQKIGEHRARKRLERMEIEAAIRDMKQKQGIAV